MGHLPDGIFRPKCEKSEKCEKSQNKKMQHPVLSSDMDSAGSIYPLRVQNEALEALGRLVENLENFDFEGAVDHFYKQPPYSPIKGVRKGHIEGYTLSEQRRPRRGHVRLNRGYFES